MNTIQYRGENHNGFSPKIWSRLPVVDFREKRNGIISQTDFMSFGGTVSSTAGTFADEGGSWLSFQSASSTIRAIDTVQGGAIAFLSNGADNDVMVLERGYGFGGGFVYTHAASGMLAFECRLRPNAAWDVSASKDLFVGLITKGMTAAATTLFSDTAATMTTTAVNAIGFTLLGSGSALKTCLQNATAVRTPVAAATLVASTWVKVGFLVNPDDTEYQVRYYVDNVQVDAVASSNANFPTGDQLTECLALKIQATDAGAGMDFDWERAAQRLF